MFFAFIIAVYFVRKLCLFIILIKPIAEKNMEHRFTRNTDSLTLYMKRSKYSFMSYSVWIGRAATA
jgi:hypothetical protein